MSERQLIESRHGPLFAYAEDRYLGEAICRYGEYSELEFRFLADVLEGCKQLYKTVVEVGANAGYLSVPLLEVASVAAYEPQASAFNLLAQNMRMNTADGPFHKYGYTLHEKAAGESSGLIRCPRHYYETPGNHGGIPMGAKQEFASMKALEWDDVPCVALDHENLPCITLIKADVEGMELAVLKGAHSLIARDQPLLYVENDRPTQSEALIRHVWKLGYWCAWHTPRMFNPDNFFGVKDNIYGDKCSVNMICVPNGRALPSGVGVKHGLKLVEDAKLHPVTGM